VALPPDAVRFDLGAGTGEWHQHNVAVRDFHSIPNSFSAPQGGPSDPGVVSFDVFWGEPAANRQVSDATGGYAGTFAEGKVSISFSTEKEGFLFVSDPAETSQSLFSWLGYETSGAYFPTPMGTPAAGA
jgi:hypothetical protein